ncbi:MAG: hypothetical protein QXI92_03680 [Candidatus Nitrosocaldus sp.]
MVRKIRTVSRAIREVSKPTFESTLKKNLKTYKLAQKIRKIRE